MRVGIGVTWLWATTLAACGGGNSQMSSSSPPPPGGGIPTPTQHTDVVTYKNDLARTGQNLTESVLTTSDVNPSRFGLLRILAADGKVDATPLYLSALTVQGASHNVVFIATENDSVYAYDSDSGALLWHVSLLVPPERKGLALGAVGLVRILPVIVFSMFAGVVADVWDRRRLMLVTQTAAALVALRLVCTRERSSAGGSPSALSTPKSKRAGTSRASERSKAASRSVRPCSEERGRMPPRRMRAISAACRRPVRPEAWLQ